jgi:HAD superfamily hydrolase (TIGR01509 family)
LYNLSVKNLFAGLRIALFDLDGTLAETAIDFDMMRREVTRLARDFGLNAPPPRDILTCVAALRDQLLGLGREDDAQRFRSQAFAMLQEIEVAQCSTPVEVPGAARLLEALEERGVAVGVVTRNCRPVSEMLLEAGGLRCRCLLTRDDVNRTKPDPSHLLEALERLEPQMGRDAQSCVMVGDHFMDVQAGRAAGMRTVGLLRGKDASHFEVYPPDLLVEGPADLLAMLEALP